MSISPTLLQQLTQLRDAVKSLATEGDGRITRKDGRWQVARGAEIIGTQIGRDQDRAALLELKDRVSSLLEQSETTGGTQKIGQAILGTSDQSGLDAQDLGNEAQLHEILADINVAIATETMPINNLEATGTFTELFDQVEPSIPFCADAKGKLRQKQSAEFNRIALRKAIHFLSKVGEGADERQAVIEVPQEGWIALYRMINRSIQSGQLRTENLDATDETTVERDATAIKVVAGQLRHFLAEKNLAITPKGLFPVHTLEGREGIRRYVAYQASFFSEKQVNEVAKEITRLFLGQASSMEECSALVTPKSGATEESEALITLVGDWKAAEEGSDDRVRILHETQVILERNRDNGAKPKLDIRRAMSPVGEEVCVQVSLSYVEGGARDEMTAGLLRTSDYLNGEEINAMGAGKTTIDIVPSGVDKWLPMSFMADNLPAILQDMNYQPGEAIDVNDAKSILFSDFDGTLSASSKTGMSDEVTTEALRYMENGGVLAISSGSGMESLEPRIFESIDRSDERLQNLIIFANNGATAYKMEKGADGLYSPVPFGSYLFNARGGERRTIQRDQLDTVVLGDCPQGNDAAQIAFSQLNYVNVGKSPVIFAANRHLTMVEELCEEEKRLLQICMRADGDEGPVTVKEALLFLSYRDNVESYPALEGAADKLEKYHFSNKFLGEHDQGTLAYLVALNRRLEAGEGRDKGDAVFSKKLVEADLRKAKEMMAAR